MVCATPTTTPQKVIGDIGIEDGISLKARKRASQSLCLCAGVLCDMIGV